MRNALDHAEHDCRDDDLGRRQWLVAFLGLLLRRPHDTMAAAAALATLMTILANALFLQPNPHPAPLFSIKGKQSSGAPRESTGTVALPRPRPPELSVHAEPARRTEPAAAAGAESAARSGPAARPLPTRSRGEIVSDIQRELTRRGLYDGPINGVHGGKTDNAIRQFEKSAGLSPSGEASEAILKTITRSPLGAKPTPTAATPHADPNPPPARIAPSAAVSDPGAPPARTHASAPPPRGDQEPASSKQVRAVQQALADFGYGQVKPTGHFDAATRQAIEEFEKVHKLPVTGQISDQFLKELVAVTDRPLE